MLAHGTTFQFKSTSYSVTSIRVQLREPEIANMTSQYDPVDKNMLVKTGAFTTPTSIDIEFIGATYPAEGDAGPLQISGSAGAYSQHAICSSVTRDARVSDVVRGTARFTVTDYTGQ